MPLKHPFVVGCDLAGKVVELGPQARRYQVGDRVWGSNQGLLGRQGTFAEFAAVDEQWLYPTPTGVSDEAAAATALVGITAHLGLVRDRRLEGGETLFVNGGAAASARWSCKWPRALGARVITTAGSDAKAGACRAVGGRPGDQLQAGRRRCPRRRLCSAGGRRLVGNAARAEFRPHHRAIGRARPDGPDGRPRCAAGLSGRAVLRQAVHACTAS